MEELITMIKESSLEEAEKIEFLKTVVHASVGIYDPIKENFYLKVLPAEKGKNPEVQLWCKRMENGKEVHGNTHFSNDFIIQMFHQNYLEENRVSTK